MRFKGFDDEWVIKRLDEISEINPKTRELPENFVYIDLDSVNNGILTKFNKINKNDAPSRAQRCLDLNDILFQTVRPYQMNNFFFELNDCDYVASTGYAQIKSQIFPRFLYYYLHYYKFVNDVLNRCTGSSYPAINSTDLKKIKIKIPSSFNEQKLIGDLFHKIDKKIELLENKYEYYQYFKKYLMQQIFTQKLRFDFDEIRLRSISKINKGKQLNKEHMLEIGKFYVLNGGQEPSGYTDSWNTSENTITISEGGNSCGFVNFNTEKFWSGGHCYYLNKLSENIDVYYLYSYLKFIEPQIMRLRVGSGLPNIQKGDIENIKIKILPKKEQIKISIYYYQLIIKLVQLNLKKIVLKFSKKDFSSKCLLYN